MIRWRWVLLGFWLFPVALGVVYFVGARIAANPMFVTSLPPGERTAVDADRLRAHVVRLTGTKRPRHADNLEDLDEAAHFIADEWKAMGLEVTWQSYLAPSGKTYHNLSVTIPGADPSARVVVGAHYDVCGEQPGADDNASGVAGILELTRALVTNKPTLPYPVDIVAFTLEEPNYYDTEWMGSYVYARALHEKGTRVKLMLSIEMIGYFTDAPGSQNFPIPLLGALPSVGNFITIVGKEDAWPLNRELKRAFRRASDLPVEAMTAPGFIEGIDYSDHRSFWAFGFPAVMITDTSFFRNHNYHKRTDTPDTLDYARMADVVRGIYQAVVSL